MRSQICIPGIIIRILMSISLLTFLSACSSSGSKQGGTQVRVNPSPTPRFNPAGAGMHIEGGSVACTEEMLNLGIVGSLGNLVLTTDGLSYDAGQIQQITNYVSALIARHGNLSQPLPLLPSALRWLPGSPPNSRGPSCFGQLGLLGSQVRFTTSSSFKH